MLKLMTKVHTRIALVRDGELGANLLEYALLLALIALGAIFAMTQIGQKTLSNASAILPGLNSP